MIGNDKSEMLYLEKFQDKEHIIVPKAHLLPLHHIEHLRFLYKQFKKGKPVIFNDCSGADIYVQVAIFLNCIQTFLKVKPVLILCDDREKINNWKQSFGDWTDFEDSLAIEPTNTFIKKTIIIGSIQASLSLTRRPWSVMVVDVENVTKEFQNANFKSDFKIWITSIDIKKSLQSFTQIYKWLHPKQPFNPEIFVAEKDNINDIIDKAIYLDAFLEDIVIRKNDKQSKKTKKPFIPVPTPHISKKNKDASGTKIKKSKRPIKIIETEEPVQAKVTKIDKVINAIETDEISKRDSSHPLNLREIEMHHLVAESKSETNEFDINLDHDKQNDLAKNENTECSLNFHDAINEIVSIENCKEIDVSIDNVDVVDVTNNVTDALPKIIVTESENTVNIDVGDGLDIMNLQQQINRSFSTEDSKDELCKSSINNEEVKTYADKFNEIEQMALKKFKGSLLDSIF